VGLFRHRWEKRKKRGKKARKGKGGRRSKNQRIHEKERGLCIGPFLEKRK